MKKIFILSNDISFTRKIDELLDKSKYNVSMPSILSNSLFSYCCNFNPDICIVHSSYLNGQYKVLEMLAMSKKCIVVYFTTIVDNSSLYNLLSSPWFYMLSDDKLMGINEILTIMQKDISIISNLEDKVSMYKEKMDEERLVRRAKLALIKYKKFTEDEAYRYILKRSMDERISKSLSAKRIISEVEK